MTKFTMNELCIHQKREKAMIDTHMYASPSLSSSRTRRRRSPRTRTYVNPRLRLNERRDSRSRRGERERERVSRREDCGRGVGGRGGGGGGGRGRSVVVVRRSVVVVRRSRSRAGQSCHLQRHAALAVRSNSATQIIRSWSHGTGHGRPVIIRRRRFLLDSASGVAFRRRRIQPHVVRSRPLDGQTLVRV